MEHQFGIGVVLMFVSNIVYVFRPLMKFALNLRMVCGMFVWCSLCVSVCMLTVSNILQMSSATAIVCSCGLFWINPVAMVLFIFYSVVLEE